MKRVIWGVLLAGVLSSASGCGLFCCGRPLDPCHRTCGGPCGDSCADAWSDSCGCGGLDYSCGSWGCGERYWGDWFEKPARICETCDHYGHWTGPQHNPPYTDGVMVSMRNGEPTPAPRSAADRQLPTSTRASSRLQTR